MISVPVGRQGLNIPTEEYIMKYAWIVIVVVVVVVLYVAATSLYSASQMM